MLINKARLKSYDWRELKYDIIAEFQERKLKETKNE